MARVHKVERAQKDYPNIGVKKGESYYWWKMKVPAGGGWHSVKRMSKTFPRRSQLTTSEFLGTQYDIEDAIDQAETPDDLRACGEDARGLGEEQASKLENMPEGLQQGSTGELLQERADACEQWADSIEAAADAWQEALDDYDPEDEEAEEPDPETFKGDIELNL